LITAVVESCPPAFGKAAVAPAAAELGKQQRFAGQLGDLLARGTPALTSAVVTSL